MGSWSWNWSAAGGRCATPERCLRWRVRRSRSLAFVVPRRTGQCGMEFFERRLDVADPASDAGDADPQDQRERGRQLGSARHTLGPIERSGVVVDAASKYQRVDRDQHEKRQFGFEERVV